MDLHIVLLGGVWLAIVLNTFLLLRAVAFLRSVTEPTSPYEGQGEPAMLGSPAPAFSVPVVGNGSRVGLETFAGRPVLLLFVSPTCHPCGEKLPIALSAAASARDRDGLGVVLIADHDPQLLQAWLQETLGASLDQIDAVVANHPEAIAVWGSFNPQGTMPSFYYLDEGHVGRATGILLQDEWEELTSRWATTPADLRDVGARP